MRAYERLIAYTAFDTYSDENSPTCPSTPNQLVFGRALVEEMKALGITDAVMDDNGYVYGTIESTVPYETPVLGLIAHMDVVHEVPSSGIKPRLVPDYDGGDVLLNAQKQILLSPAESPDLKKYIGKTLLVTDGTTLLGADDKAGIADILTLAEILLGDKSIPHGKLRIAFTPDEEIGRGADKFDVPFFGADFAYTLDGGAFGEVEYENFNASSAVVTVTGKSFHPGSSKGRMVNAQDVAIRFHTLLPESQKPCYTQGYEGFFHLTDMRGTVEQAQLHYILRDHDEQKLQQKEALMRKTAQYLNACYPGDPVQVQITPSYRNMAGVIAQNWHLIENAQKVVRELGAQPITVPVRGGTDGSRLSFMGLPCPNLGTGGHNGHGRLEYAVVEEMDLAVQMLLKLTQLYGQR